MKIVNKVLLFVSPIFFAYTTYALWHCNYHALAIGTGFVCFCDMCSIAVNLLGINNEESKEE